MATGTATINFGAFPGATDTSLPVTGQATIAAGSLVEAWVRPVATAEHNADEHWVEEIQVTAGNIVAGTGFTIYARIGADRAYSTGSRLYGQWTVAWAWV
jgi:hypothetical protein